MVVGSAGCETRIQPFFPEAALSHFFFCAIVNVMYPFWISALLTLLASFFVTGNWSNKDPSYLLSRSLETRGMPAASQRGAQL